MYKNCKNCGKQFIYNTSVGDPGIMCPYCGKPANVRFAGQKIKDEDKSAIKELLDDFNKSKNNEKHDVSRLLTSCFSL